MNEREVMGLMRENAALCILEAEVIVALRYYESGNERGLFGQIDKIYQSIAAVDAVRKNSHEKI